MGMHELREIERALPLHNEAACVQKKYAQAVHDAAAINEAIQLMTEPLSPELFSPPRPESTWVSPAAVNAPASVPRWKHWLAWLVEEGRFLARNVVMEYLKAMWRGDF